MNKLDNNKMFEKSLKDMTATMQNQFSSWLKMSEDYCDHMHDLQTKMFKSAKKQCCGDHKNNEKDTGGLKISAIATPKEKPKKSSEPVNEDTIEGNWKHLMQDAQKQWSKLTNDNLAQINGSREKLAQALQKNYSIASEEAEKQMKEWEKSRSNTVKSATNS